MGFLSVMKKDLKLLWKDKPQLAVLFLMPLAFILPISYAMGSNAYGPGIDEKRALPIVDQDAGGMSTKLQDLLAESLKLETAFTLEEAERLVAGERRAGALIIPAGFSEDIEAQKKTPVTLILNPASGDSAGRLAVQGVVEGAAMAISVESQVKSGFQQMNDMLAFAPAEIQEQFGSEAKGDADQSAYAQDSQDTKDYAPIEVRRVQPASYQRPTVPDTYQQNVPGYTVMFVFFIIQYLSGSIKEERAGGTLRRLLTAPTRRASILGGKLAAAFLVGMLQVAAMFAVAVGLFGMRLGEDLLALILLTAALAASATTLGLLTATTRLEGTLVPLLIVSALLGGCIFPIDWMPAFLQSVSLVIPHRWALAGYQDLMVRGGNIWNVLPEIGVLLAFSLAFFVLAVRRFRNE